MNNNHTLLEITRYNCLRFCLNDCSRFDSQLFRYKNI